MRNCSKINSRRLAAGLFLIAAVSAAGAPVSPERAAGLALELKTRTYLKKAIAEQAYPAPRLVKTFTSGDKACFYIFNYGEGNGYAVMSADDRLPAVIGFSDRGDYDESDLPPSLKHHLESYRRQIGAVMASEGGSTQQAVVYREPVAPLMTSMWDQSGPYNNLCPVDKRNRRCVTGCVATAVAQVMRYHEWPVKGVGSYGGYSFAHTYDWSNMLDSYEDSYTSAQGKAVAQLMVDVGKAVKMDYGYDASGAYSTDIAPALQNYFGYGSEIEINWADYMSRRRLNDMVYGEIAEGRPVIYGGAGDEGGHQFVIDGYLENDYFHVNWGWSGMYDGYFLLTLLNPGTGGTGAGAGDFSLEQDFLTGVMPGDYDGRRQIELLSTAGFRYISSSGNTASFEVYPYMESDNYYDQYGLVYNPFSYTVTLDTGLRLRDVSRRQDVVFLTTYSGEAFEELTGYDGFDAQVSGIPDGEYKVTQVFRETDGGDWKDVKIPLGYQNHVLLTIDNGKCVWRNVEYSEDKSPEYLYLIPSAGDLWADSAPAIAFEKEDSGFYSAEMEVPAGIHTFVLSASATYGDDDSFGAGAEARTVEPEDISFTNGEAVHKLAKGGKPFRMNAGNGGAVMRVYADLDAGKVTFNSDIATLVDDIATDSDNSHIREYYNLQGIRVFNPGAGVYIMRDGDRFTKVIIR